MKRREFLQWGGMAAAGSMLSACGKSTEKLIPFLIPPDDGSVPGVANYFASTCRQCPAGCGILVRIAEGRAKKIEGNPLHPVNRGRLCARGQAALQDLYHPDRIRRPLRRTGARGSGEFSPISWEEGMGLLEGRLKELKETGKAEGLLLMTPPLRGTLRELVGSFMDAYGSRHHLSYEFLNTECHEQANRSVYGREDLPDLDIENTRYLLSFGADLLETYLSPVRYGNAFGRMRQLRATIRGTFTYAGARMSMTAASADRWLPVKTGQEGILALGMARLILDERLYDPDAVAQAGGSVPEWKNRLSGYDLKRVAEETGLSADLIASTARAFATIRPSLAVAGDAAASQSNGKAAVEAVQFLNVLVGNVGKPGGLLFPSRPSGPGDAGSFADLLATIDAMERGAFELAMIYRTNPVHGLPPSAGFQKAFSKIPFVVAFSSLMDDTARHADLILPDHTDLESWGDVLPRVGVRARVIGLVQPVVEPLYDTRAFPECVLGAARDLGIAESPPLSHKNYLDMLKQSVQEALGVSSGPAFQRTWMETLRKGGVFEPESPVSRRTVPGKVRPRGVQPPRFKGAPEGYPLHLLLFVSPALYDGRNAHLPWLQEMPDPMTTAVWGSWVELHPETAKSLGIGQGDRVLLESPQGKIRVPAVIYPGIRPDVVAVPLGQGHQGMGRYADGVGENPLRLLSLVMDEQNKLPAWGATKVRVRRISGKGDLVVMGHPQGSYRGELLEI